VTTRTAFPPAAGQEGIDVTLHELLLFRDVWQRDPLLSLGIVVYRQVV
jgi:hypothetical protein